MDFIEPLLRVSDLTIRYADRKTAPPVVANFSFLVSPGEVVHLAGPNGSGKTTLLKAFAGLLGPRASVEGTIWASGPCVYVGDDLTCSFALTVEDLLGLADLKRSIRGCVVTEAIDLFCLGPILGSVLGALSHGQRQRVNLARSWVQGSSVLLLDESLSALDSATRAHVTRQLEERKQRGLGTVLVTHESLSGNLINQKYMVAPNA